MHDFRFEFDDGDDDSSRALNSMYRWLRQDPDLRREVDVELVADNHPGQMGAVDMVSVALTQLTGIGGLAVAVAGWWQSRADTPAAKVSLGGNTVSISNLTAEQLAAVLTLLMEKQQAESAPGAGEPVGTDGPDGPGDPDVSED